MGMIRKWLCSAFRVGPQRPVSEVPDLPSHPAARPPILASFRGEILYFQPPANQKRKLLYDLASFRCLPPAPSTLSSIARRPRPTTTTRTPASPSGAALDAMAAAGCPPRLMLLPAPGPWPPAPGPRPPSCPYRPPPIAVSNLNSATYTNAPESSPSPARPSA